MIIKQGVPKLRPFPAALKQWVLPASASTDFQYLLLSVLFLQARPMALVLSAICTTVPNHFLLLLLFFFRPGSEETYDSIPNQPSGSICLRCLAA